MHKFRIKPVSQTLAVELQTKIDRKIKPLGALGDLERVALQLGLIQGSLSPRLSNPHVLVCAGDHGAAKAGVSAYPQDVTWQMVENFLHGGAAISVFTRANGMGLTVADAGVAHDFGPRNDLLDAKVAPGTGNYLEGPAMTLQQAQTAVSRGVAVVAELAAQGCNVLGFGEMGIGNTASASLLTHALTGIDLPRVVGRGTGLDDAGVSRKLGLLQQALACWPERPVSEAGKGFSEDQVLEILARFGGFEIAMLAGAMLASAERGMVLLIDGFIVTSALLVAAAIEPAVLEYCIYTHCSDETGHKLQLDHLSARPLISLGLRLGEGTGAALAYPLVNAAAAFLRDMASFESAGVSDRA